MHSQNEESVVLLSNDNIKKTYDTRLPSSKKYAILTLILLLFTFLLFWIFYLGGDIKIYGELQDKYFDSVESEEFSYIPFKTTMSPVTTRNLTIEVTTQQSSMESFENTTIVSTEWPTLIGPAYNFTSTLSKNINSVYTDCSKPSKTYDLNHAGFGSDLHVLSQAVCRINETYHKRLVPIMRTPWRWADRKKCGRLASIHCYFKLPLCPGDDQGRLIIGSR